MPIQVKTMRDIWDKGKEARKQSIEKYYLEYLARKKAFSERKDEIAKIFADYEKRLGEAGFSKI